jgi:hypothetical protein
MEDIVSDSGCRIKSGMTQERAMRQSRRGFAGAAENGAAGMRCCSIVQDKPEEIRH